MNDRRKTLAEITDEAFALLNRELGAEDAARFIDQYKNGFDAARIGAGDYTAERDALFGHLTLEEIFADIKKAHPDPTQ